MADTNPPTHGVRFEKTNDEFTEEERQAYREEYYDKYETDDEEDNEQAPEGLAKRSNWEGEEDREEKHRFRPAQIIRTAMIRYADPDAAEKDERERERKKNMFIDEHVESIVVYEKFILKLTEAMMVFGYPSHRVVPSLQTIGKVCGFRLAVSMQPGVTLLSFGRWGEPRIVKAGGGVALSRLNFVHAIYMSVLKDEMFSSRGTRLLKRLLYAPPLYTATFVKALNFVTSSLVCGIAFGGSFNDMWLAGIIGLAVRFLQSDESGTSLSRLGNEVFLAALVSFISRAVSSVTPQLWCFSAVSSSSIISMLPGGLILQGALDVSARNMELGAPKLVAGIVSSLCLGFGMTMGSDAYLKIDSSARQKLLKAADHDGPPIYIQAIFSAINASDSGILGSGNATMLGNWTLTNPISAATSGSMVNGCYRDHKWGWYLQPLDKAAVFPLVPIFITCVSLGNQQWLFHRQLTIMVTIGTISFWVSKLANNALGLYSHPDYVGLIGSFTIGTLGNVYARASTRATAFTVMLSGIGLLIPDGLSAAGGLTGVYSNSANSSQDEYTQSLLLARSMVSVIIGILTGVFVSAALVGILGRLFGKKKSDAMMTF